ncbi:MAG: hypothetical protein JST00_21200 [Deltaproteobacteria bacterium]|nr:hypothetical protein [Deltaproteobacteria bacterium]
MRLPSLLFSSSLLLTCALQGACATTRPNVDPGPPSPVVEYVQAQEILTPLPLRVRLPAAMNAEHVVVLYKTWGSRGWRAHELGRDGQTWSGEVSCREVSTVTGDTRYYFVAFDDGGALVAGSGSPDWPHVATIVGKLEGGAQSLAGERAPMRCHDPADCPPDFPGCPSYAMKRATCRSDRDCAEAGQDRCSWDGYCVGAPDADLIVGTPPSIDSSEEEQLEAALAVVKRRFSKNRAPAPRSGG